MVEIVKYIDGQQFSAVYIVGDLHGWYSLLIQELKKINFDFSNDLLICTGDLIDRGTENLEFVGLLEQPWFCTVRGNHEEMCIRGQHDPKMKDMHEKMAALGFIDNFKRRDKELSKAWKSCRWS